MIQENVVHFVIIVCVLDDDVEFNIFKTFLPHNQIVLYIKIACELISAAQTALVDCVVNREAHELDVLLWYVCYCIEASIIFAKIVQLVILTSLGAAESRKNLVPFLA